VSKRALERKVSRGVIAEIALPAGATLVHGKRREDLGQLEGKAYKHTGVSFWPDYNVTETGRRSSGSRVTVIASSRRPARARRTVREVVLG
jgi:hypothetical protein